MRQNAHNFLCDIIGVFTQVINRKSKKSRRGKTVQANDITADVAASAAAAAAAAAGTSTGDAVVVATKTVRRKCR